MESQQKLNRTHKTIEEKIKIVRFAEQNSIHKAAEKYNVYMFQNIETKNPLQIKQYIYIMFVSKI